MNEDQADRLINVMSDIARNIEKVDDTLQAGIDVRLSREGIEYLSGVGTAIDDLRHTLKDGIRISLETRTQDVLENIDSRLDHIGNKL